MPIIVFDTKEMIPEGLREESVEITEENDNKGKWQINAVSKAKLDSFRDRNTEQASELEVLRGEKNQLLEVLEISSLEDFDKKQYQDDIAELKVTAQKVADGKIKSSDELDKALELRVSAMRTKFDENLRDQTRELSNMRGERDEAIKMFKRTHIDKEVVATVGAGDTGLHHSAIPDVIRAAYNVFEVQEDTSLIPKREGQTIWGEDGSLPMPMAEWITTTLRVDKPHYFKQSDGGGASGGAETVKLGTMSPEEFNSQSAEAKLSYANENPGSSSQ